MRRYGRLIAVPGALAVGEVIAAGEPSTLR